MAKKKQVVQQPASSEEESDSDQEEQQVEVKKKRRVKAKKDPNAPKRAKSAYLFFGSDKRAEINANNPGQSVVDTMKQIGSMWRDLRDKDKIPYQEMADEDKVRYEDEMKDYEVPAMYRGGKGSKKAKKDPNKPKRAKSAYLYFGSEKRNEINEKSPGQSVVDTMKEIGRMWRELNEDDKTPYQELADEDKVRYSEEMENYSA